MCRAAHRVLDSMRLPNGLYIASPAEEYRYVWIRDVCYTALAYLDDDGHRFDETCHRLLDIFHRHRWKLDHHAVHRPNAVFEYLHPRYDATTLDEIHEPWGNAQNDAIGALLYLLGLGLSRGRPVLRNDEDRAVVRQLVRYLGTLTYWQDADNGMWEENREIHASSIGACAAGLLALRKHVDVPWEIIQAGLAELHRLLPRESPSKPCDLAQLSLVYPYRLLPRDLARHVVEEVERTLLRERGVIRYLGDRYYRHRDREAEWCLGLPWLGLCWDTLGERDRALSYLRWTEWVMVAPGVLPELYYGGTDRPNPHTPLAWAVSLYVQLARAMTRSPSSSAGDDPVWDTAKTG
ncbi:glycoside hydrolase family 15 protein [Alicyclobacillus sp.]|uniref:glycoside hydrolase family 15 protein n=1 Tax=Alicyclobacillus sp. TaxID=61169 RepID=UPI0025C162F9|nr:glycoside hydrolase family 15 protein [Alicyclobacillus sp.]MCL6515564.1 glycoside hydrolase family 15 protein [Alicyclobacillus sp.]